MRTLADILDLNEGLERHDAFLSMHTMNTASRMESSGERDRIQVTQATADLLKEAGYVRWFIPRSSSISVKCKGEMQTLWVRKAKSPVAKRSTSLDCKMSTVDERKGTECDGSAAGSSGEFGIDSQGIQPLTKTERLVEWDMAVFTSLLKQIIASRGGVVHRNQITLH
eukprot:scaffold757_cov74-Cylindrotheca_fusiformis.AAC.4